MNKQLADLFIKSGRVGLNKFIQVVRNSDIKATNKQITDFYKNQEVNQLTKKAVIRKDKFRAITAPPLSFQMDKIFINKKFKGKADDDKSKSNFYEFLLFVDITTKKAYIYKLPPSSTNNKVIEAYEKFLDDLLKDINKLKDTYNEYTRTTPISISTDNGFGNYFKKYNEEELSVPVDNKIANDDHITKSDRLGIIDRLVRTLKFMLTKKVFAGDDILPIDKTMKDIVNIYNNTPNVSIENYTPNQAFDDKNIRYQLYMKKINYNLHLNDDSDLNVGDKVRIFEKQGIFGKETAQFSKDIYTIQSEDGAKFKVMNKDGQIQKRLFKPAELQKIDENKVENTSSQNVGNEIKQAERKQRQSKELKKLKSVLTEKTIKDPVGKRITFYRKQNN
jgi:hypothetical protein